MITMKATKLVLALTIAACVAAPVFAEKKYTGPRPPKTDVPFLQHASTLIEVEKGEADEAHSHGNITYSVAGATSRTRTPVPEPVFYFQSDKINPEHMVLYKMDTKSGQRTLTMPEQGRRKDTHPIFMLIDPVSSSVPGLWKIEVNEVIDPGEYCLSPEGVNTVYCFTEY
jgi:hypothetical protein